MHHETIPLSVIDAYDTFARAPIGAILQCEVTIASAAAADASTTFLTIVMRTTLTAADGVADMALILTGEAAGVLLHYESLKPPFVEVSRKTEIVARNPGIFEIGFAGATLPGSIVKLASKPVIYAWGALILPGQQKDGAWICVSSADASVNVGSSCKNFGRDVRISVASIRNH